MEIASPATPEGFAGHGLSITDLSEAIKWHWKNSNIL